MDPDFIDNVISLLDVPPKATVVSQEYANTNNFAREVQAYAKIAGRDWTYYVKTLKVTIGRNTSSASSGIGNEERKNDPEDNVDIDLGPAKVVSRKHAKIQYNLNNGAWELLVDGRNGAKVNFTRVQAGPNSPSIKLFSGTIIDIGGTQMMFILPDSDPVLMPNVLKHLEPKLQQLHELRQKNSVKGFIRMYNNDNSAISVPGGPIQPINAATPTSNATRNTGGYVLQQDQHQYPQQDQQVLDNGYHGMMVMNGNNTNMLQAHFEGGTIVDPGFPSTELNSDLSRPENKNVKPPFSYATMITQAILSTHEGAMSLADIYNFIENHYSYYKYSKSGWQNSIRHNLSLNKAFEKVNRRPGEPGKGMKWRIAENFQKEFLDRYREGKVSKIKRGSSVVRQLQLQLSRYGTIPIQREYSAGNNPEDNSHGINNKKGNDESSRVKKKRKTSKKSAEKGAEKDNGMAMNVKTAVNTTQQFVENQSTMKDNTINNNTMGSISTVDGSTLSHPQILQQQQQHMISNESVHNLPHRASTATIATTSKATTTIR
ncbi:uncharacterized protein SCODWIG_03933 [Saccharomycodes ludwigii]|uniref:Fork-head transcriptional regulator 2 n=1 Tax=Saccharomycodes ludwigii TaxID=36035 RepID=A0A376BC51_9ASCO|nr:uncharacterized protein SCODWIG_03933 [Saccharomycodes ludwigii]